MALKEYKAEKLLYTMGEVTEMFDVKASLIRFWSDRFDILKPKKNKKGNRLFSPGDVKNLEIIYHLTRERGMTLAGVEKILNSNREGAEREMEIVRRLQTIRSLLLGIREELKEGPQEEVRVFVESVSPEAEPEIVAEEVLPGEITDDEPAGDDFWSDEALLEELRASETEAEEEPETWDEEAPDLQVGTPFTAQPLFELEETPEFAPEYPSADLLPEEEAKSAAVDTQQSLF